MFVLVRILPMQFIKLKINPQIFAICFLIGMCLSIWFFYNKIYLFLLFFILFILNIFFNYKHSKPSSPYVTLIILSLFAGFSWVCWNIVAFKKQNYSWAELENHSTLVRGIVVDIPYKKNKSIVFNIIINNSDKIRLRWFDAPFEIVTGDCWQLYVKLKKPRNFFTPGSFDVEKHMFSQKIHAIGTVIKNNNNLLIKPYEHQQFNYNIFIDHIRQKIVNKINTNNHFTRPNIIAALSLGVKNNIALEDLVVFQNTGTLHLLAISGLHISFMIGVGFYLSNLLWKNIASNYWLEKIPAPIVAANCGICCAILYASLSGFFVATKRAFIMAVLYLLAVIYRQEITKIQIYYYALILILIIEPFAILSSGFWLSFIAVGILLYKKPNNLISGNLAIFIGLLPVSCFVFGSINIISIVANFFAVPYFGVFILPWVFMGIVLYGVGNLYIGYIVLKFADFNLQLLIFVLNKLQQIATINIGIASPNILVLILSSIGSIWLLLPKGLLNRYIAIICFLPLFFDKQEMIKHDDALISFLDVGQGLATVIKLQNHIILYDVGPDNKVVVNYLKNFKHRIIHSVIVSHTDFDHIGGLKDIINYSVVNNFITNKNYNASGLESLTCNANQAWSIDGLNFKFLNPAINLDINNNTNNDNSCVLKISNANFSVLLTGDISNKAEKLLIKNHYADLKADLLLIPHHGSRHSSSLEFIQAVQPRYAVVSAGYINKYGHPKPRVLNKYLANNIMVFNTIEHGTIDFLLKAHSLDYNCYKFNHKNFWNY